MLQMQLPTWVVGIQAIAVPIIGILITAVGSWIALQQMKTARTKLSLDLYDRRFAIYASAKALVSEVLIKEDIEYSVIAAFIVTTSDAVFLLNDEIVSHLNAIAKKASSISVANRTINTVNDDATEHKIATQISADLDWFRDQPQILIGKFSPFLRLGNIQHFHFRRNY